METEFLVLENKIEQLVGLVAHLRTQNRELSAQLHTTNVENQQLREAVSAAKDRVTRLIASIPEEDEEDGESTEDGEA